MVGCHSFDRDLGEVGYFLISAHILLVHGHVMPLTTRLMALNREVPVSPLFRDILRQLTQRMRGNFPQLNIADRMAVYEARDSIYLAALGQREQLYRIIEQALVAHYRAHDADPSAALKVLQLDQALCPREGDEQRCEKLFQFDASAVHGALAAMELPGEALADGAAQILEIQHPGGVGEILKVADGGSWAAGNILTQAAASPPGASELAYVAIA